MKVIYVTTTEEMVLNPKYKDLRICRIEVWTDQEDQHYPHEVGRIEISNDDELFEAVRAAIEGEIIAQ